MAYQELIPDEILDGQLTFRDLTVISKHILEWSDKARVLGLSESEIENIREDNKNSHEQQKSAMMRKWGEKYGEKATLKSLLDIAEHHGWTKFIHDVCKEWGYEINEGRAGSSVLITK